MTRHPSEDMMHTPTDISGCTHIMRGDSAGGSLSQGAKGVRRNLLVLRDTLSQGPCCRDPRRFGAVRRDYWQQWFEREDLFVREGLASYLQEWDTIDASGLLAALGRFDPAQPVVIWTLASWIERLTLWWILDAFRRGGTIPDRVWIVDVPQDRRYRIGALGGYTTQELQEAFPLRQPLGADAMREGAALWMKFAARSPAAFDTARRTGSTWFPDLPESAAPHCLYFPLSACSGETLRLNHSDQVLFDNLSATRWKRPVTLLNSPDIESAFFHLFDLDILAQRLHDWAGHRPLSPALEVRPEPRGINIWTNASYRLTEAGCRLRDRGLDRATDAPPFWAGGCQVYAGRNPWVRRDDGAGWRLERFRPC
jgi:hypothetical protein